MTAHIQRKPANPELEATMQKQSDPAYDLAAETEAATILLANLRDIVADDDQAAADIVEGETNLLEAINAAVDLVQQHEAHADAISARIKTLQDRKARLQNKADLTREAIAVAMDVAKRKKLATPLGTVSVCKTPVKLEVVDESEVPSTYWKRPDPVLDKKALTDALKAAAITLQMAIAGKTEEEAVAIKAELREKLSIPGCKLSEAGTTIAIRA